MASPKIDTTEKAKEKIVDNLLVLHTKICNEGDVYSIMDFTRYLFKLLEKRGKKFEYLVSESNLRRSEFTPMAKP